MNEVIILPEDADKADSYQNPLGCLMAIALERLFPDKRAVVGSCWFNLSGEIYDFDGDLVRDAYFTSENDTLREDGKPVVTRPIRIPVTKI